MNKSFLSTSYFTFPMNGIFYGNLIKYDRLNAQGENIKTKTLFMTFYQLTGTKVRNKIATTLL